MIEKVMIGKLIYQLSINIQSNLYIQKFHMMYTENLKFEKRGIWGKKYKR